MNRVAAAWIVIVCVALAFRVAQLPARPMHADEAVLAAKLGQLIDSGSFKYDPRDYHGPALAWLSSAASWVGGARNYNDLTETMLRMVPALCGVLLVLMPLLLSGGIGRWQAAVAGGLTAIAPAMVYYSRYYIPEMLLVALTSAAIVCGYRYARTGTAVWAIAAGACAGVMLVTKETAAIALACMLIALACTVRTKPPAVWHVVAGLAVAILIPVLTLGFADSGRAIVSYSQRAFEHPQHRHPWHYYLGLLVWSQGLIAALALAGVGVAIRKNAATDIDARLLRFLAVYACTLTLAYSAIPYKTPWCVVGPLHAMILLAGPGAVALLRALRGRRRFVIALVLAACAVALALQSWRASFPRASDPHNPLAYAHTGPDVYAVRASVDRLARNHPQRRGMPIQVISGQNIWPLPWYFRTFSNVGWWRRVEPGFRPADVILVTPDMEAALIHEIYEVPPPGSRELFQSIFDRYTELRPQLELRGYVRASVAELR